jgi:hypothetical protein
MSWLWSGGWTNISINYRNYSTKIGGLGLARHILKQIRDDNENFSIDLVSKEYNNKKFVCSITEFLKDITWLSEDENGKYVITKEGLENNIDHLRF